MAWRISLRPLLHMTNFSSISQKKNKSLQLTIAWYYLPIVFSMTTKHNFHSFLCMITRLENVAKCCMSYRTFQYGIAPIQIFAHELSKQSLKPCSALSSSSPPYTSLWMYDSPSSCKPQRLIRMRLSLDYLNLGDYPNPFRSSWPSWLTGEAPVRGTRRTSHHHPWSGRCPGGSWSPGMTRKLGGKNRYDSFLIKSRFNNFIRAQMNKKIHKISICICHKSTNGFCSLAGKQKKFPTSKQEYCSLAEKLPPKKKEKREEIN